MKKTFSRFNNSVFLVFALIGLQPSGYFIVFEGIVYDLYYPGNERTTKYGGISSYLFSSNSYIALSMVVIMKMHD